MERKCFKNNCEVIARDDNKLKKSNVMRENERSNQMSGEKVSKGIALKMLNHKLKKRLRGKR